MAVRLVAAQRELGRPVELVGLVNTPFPRWAGRHPLVAAAALADFYWVRKNAHTAFFSLFRNQHAARISRELARRDGILHLHWLPGFLWPATLLAAPLKAQKVIWSIQDLWPFTGGCHYANECREFERTCADCPQVRRPFQRRVAATLRRKQEGLQGRRDLLLVAPSEWTRALIQASAAMRGLPTAVVPNPVDTQRFSPLERNAIRAKWGVDPAAFVVGVGAADLRDERKQIPQTLSVMRDWIGSGSVPRPIQVLVFGAGGPLPGWPPAFRFLGSSPDAATLAEWYNAMDAYVSLSRYETFGNTLAEAAACGTPSICLTGSGMAEVVVPDQTGRHVRAPEELPAALADWVKTPARAREMGAAACQDAQQRFSAAVVARRFLDLYDGSTT